MQKHVRMSLFKLFKIMRQIMNSSTGCTVIYTRNRFIVADQIFRSRNMFDIATVSTMNENRKHSETVGFVLQHEHSDDISEELFMLLATFETSYLKTSYMDSISLCSCCFWWEHHREHSFLYIMFLIRKIDLLRCSKNRC